MVEINVKGPTATPDALSATTPGAGDVVSKLQRYLTGDRRLSAKKAAKLLAGAMDDYLEDEASAAGELDGAEQLIEQLRNAGIQGKTPEQIAEELAQLIEGGSPPGSAEHLEKFLRARVDERLRASEVEE